MSIIPCSKNVQLQGLIRGYVDVLKTEAHKLGTHGLSEEEFYKGGLFRGAIESVRGEFSATMRDKREFARDILNYMQDKSFIREWEPSGASNRHDYTVVLASDRIAVIELKGCLDGNNTTIFDRPPNAHEFILWSICTNGAADPKKNAWSGLNTRLSAELITRQERVDGLVIWDMFCGTIERPSPKLHHNPERVTQVAHYSAPPPCIYVFPATVASPRNNPHPPAQEIQTVEVLKAFHDCFGGRDEEINYVDFEVAYRGSDTVRKTRVTRGGVVVKESRMTRDPENLVVDPLRRRTMQAVRSTNTTPEISVRLLLSSEGFRFRLHRKDLPGVPDIALPGRKKVIFVNGCFWHCHSCARGKREPKENAEYWREKRRRNTLRDLRNRRALREMGWQPFTVWECELKDMSRLRKRLLQFLDR